MTELEFLEQKRSEIQQSLDFALSEREKIRKIARELPRLRVENKTEIGKLEKLLLDFNCLIELKTK